MQENLFGKKVIRSTSYDQDEILRDILFLHGKGKQIDCDPCYSIGNFYKKNNITLPKYKFDKYPQSKDVVEANCYDLPLLDGSCEIINFDPPFLVTGTTEDYIENDVMSKRFSSFKNFNSLKFVYYESLREFYRILKQDGIVIFKCQDVLNSNKNYFTHCVVMNFALQIGFYPKDLFLLLANSRKIGFGKQQHARKFHCYYWVFSKEICKIDYKYQYDNTKLEDL